MKERFKVEDVKAFVIKDTKENKVITENIDDKSNAEILCKLMNSFEEKE